MAEGTSDNYMPIFTCEADFEKIWRRDSHVKAKCFSDMKDDIIAHSFVFKSFRNEFETEHLFTKKNVKMLKSGQLNFDNITQRQDVGTPSSVPGFKPESYIAAKSCLNRKEMTMCFAMYQELCCNKTLNQEMLAIYNEYIPKIQMEQTEYQNAAKEFWIQQNKERQSNILPEIIDCTNHSWKERLERVSWYPKHYVKVADISLVHPGENKDSELAHIKLAKHVGPLPHYAIPDLKKKKLNVFQHLQELKNSDGEDQIPVPNSYKKVHKVLHEIGYHPDVSKDKLAKKIALNNQVDIVLSASGFLHLINNHPKTVGKSWDLPILIEEYSLDQGKKKVIYIDKALPKKSLSAVERYKWFAKVHLNKLLKCHHRLSKKNSKEDIDPVGARVHNDTELKTCGVDRDDLKMDTDEKLLSSSSSDNELVIDSNLEAENEEHMTTEVPKIETENNQRKLNLYEKISYNIWSLKSETSSTLLKSNLKDLDILIRSKSAGKKVGKSDHFKVSPKLEYQAELGAEVITVSEALQDWGNILIRPGCKLLRARLDALTGDLVMFEEKTIQDLTKEIKRLYSFNTHYRLNCLHTLLRQLFEFDAGSYLLSHSTTNDSFANLYKSEPNKPTFNLVLSYLNVDPTIIAPPRFNWCKIDPFVITPTCLYFNRIPAMYHPKRYFKITSKLEARNSKAGKKNNLPKKQIKKSQQVDNQPTLKNSDT